jgi:LysM repeat protein
VVSNKDTGQSDVKSEAPANNKAVEKPAHQPHPATKPQSAAKYHTVKQGDTLYAIAKKYHTTVDKICKLNKIKETTILQIGRKLRVK